MKPQSKILAMVFFVTVLLTSQSALSEVAYMGTWVSGSNMIYQDGIYGTKGLAAPNNVPGGRSQPVSWIDSSGNLWLFGGYGVDKDGHYGLLNDLWKFDGTNWTWVSGSDTTGQSGVYGTKGVAASGNIPGARYQSISWIDAGGNLWLFGGGGRNDLWKFDGTNWTWVSGSDTTGQPGVYGTKGVAASGNVPGARHSSVSWVGGISGYLWLFGGRGYGASGPSGSLNDLWKFDGTNWTWVSGSNAINQVGVYGTKGYPDSANDPGGRYDSASWTDLWGNFWLFGGDGYPASSSEGHLNDLWKFDGTNWTWVSGSDTINQYGIYGTKGLPASDNVPGGRKGCVLWITAGNIWLFGGTGYNSGFDGFLRDLWEFDTTNWTWAGGSNDWNQLGIYGTKGVAASGNVPGARTSSVSWTGSNGNLWLFGGWGYATDGLGALNDLWKFEVFVIVPDVVGMTQTVAESAIWNVDLAPKTVSNAYSSTVPAGSVVSQSPTAGSPVAFRSQVNIVISLGPSATVPNVAGMTQSAAQSAITAAGLIVGTVTNSYSSTILSGYVISQSPASGLTVAVGSAVNIVVSLGPAPYRAMWTWVSGSNLWGQYGVYGTKGVPASGNIPGARNKSATWIDSSGNLWLFGGYGFIASDSHDTLNDLWKFDGTNWTWVSGSNMINQYGVYGTKGVAASGNVPGTRYSAVSWIDASGNLWLCGGYGYASSGYSYKGYLNDLWKFNGTQWTWVSGSKATNQYGVYGTKGVAASGNVPGTRYSAVSWIDASGNLWLCGGYGYATSGSEGYLNDLWKFDGTNWIWVCGSNTTNQQGTYGIKGVAASSNVPGARCYSVSWIDASDNLWLFGGWGYAAGGGVMNDLWKFDGTNWTWVSGSDTTGQPGVYGTKGVSASGNIPGARYQSISWIDAGGNLWLWGGRGGTDYYLNDLWKFDGTNWTWVSGSDTINQPGIYGIKGVAVLDNVPGSRYSPVSWTDASDNLWLFGGWGYSASGPSGFLNDLWKFGIPEKAADINGDGIVNYLDMMTLIDQWLQPPSNPSADIAPSPIGDGIVNFRDFTILASHWMQSM